MFKKCKSKLMVFVLVMTLLSTAMISVFVGCGAEPTVTDVQMMMPPDKTEYVVDEKFDTTGMVITAVYSDGTRKEVTDYTIDKTGALTLEDKVVTISYGEYKFEQAITVVKPGDKIIMILANGVDRCELYADGTLQLAGGGGRLMKPNVAKWSWDGNDLEIWIPLVTAGAVWGQQTVDEEPTKMELEYDEQNNIQFAYMLAGRWQMHYFIQYKEWSAVLTPDVHYPI